MTKKGQMEIMGLAIVMILLLLGFLFTVRFIISKPKTTSIATQFRETQFSANILTAMLKSTSADCYGQSMTDLYKDCADTGGFGIRCETGVNSCGYVEDALGELLNATFADPENPNERFKRDYRLVSCIWDFINEECRRPLLTNVTVGDCASQTGEYASNPIPVSGGTVRVSFFLCG